MTFFIAIEWAARRPLLTIAAALLLGFAIEGMLP